MCSFLEIETNWIHSREHVRTQANIRKLECQSSVCVEAYSVLSACIGSTDAARRAGRKHASKAVSKSTNPTVAKAG